MFRATEHSSFLGGILFGLCIHFELPWWVMAPLFYGIMSVWVVGLDVLKRCWRPRTRHGFTQDLLWTDADWAASKVVRRRGMLWFAGVFVVIVYHWIAL